MQKIHCRAGRGRIGGSKMRRGWGGWSISALRGRGGDSTAPSPPNPGARPASPPSAALLQSPGPQHRRFGSFRGRSALSAGRSRGEPAGAPPPRPGRRSPPPLAPRRGASPRARARPPPGRAWPPIKEAGRARHRHYPLRSERQGAEARRSLGTPQPHAPSTLAPRSR